MQILIWTFGILLCLAFATWARMETYAKVKQTSNIFLIKKGEDRKVALKAREVSFDFLQNRLRKKKEKEKPFGGGRKKAYTPILYLEYPPYNAKLNLYLLLARGKESPYFPVLIRLFHYLNPDERIELYESIAEQIVEKCSEDQSKLQLKKISDLGRIRFDKEKEQELFFGLLKGPLLEYVSLEAKKPKKGINIHFAKKELLAALFDDLSIAEAIVDQRDSIYKAHAIISSIKHRLSTKYFLKREMVDAILKEHHKTLIDFEYLLDFQIPTCGAKDFSAHYSVVSTDAPTGITSRKKLFNN